MSGNRKVRLAILGSGRGSNFTAIADACAAGQLAAELAVVLTDVADSGILRLAHERGIKSQFIPPGKFRTKLDDEAESAFVEALDETQVDWIVLAGFMRILKGEFLRAFPNRVLNIHPSLLPSFPGLEAWTQALEYGVKVTGCTVHIVDQGVDTGPILGQRTVPVMDDDTPALLYARIQQAENLLYPEVLQALATGRLVIHGRRSVAVEEMVSKQNCLEI